MNFFKKPIVFLACAMLAAPFSGFAQYKYEVEPFFSYFKEAKRYELGFNYVMPFGEFAGVTRVINNSGTFLGDTTTKRNITATSGFGGQIGLSLPVKATGHISCFAASFHIMGNMFAWTGLNPTQKADGTVNTVGSKSVDATTIQISVPIGFDWKAGNDAILTKRLPFGTTMGVGAMPQVTMTSLATGNIDSKMSFGCTPYAKAELSIFAGLDFKLRAMYSVGNITLIDVNKAIPGSTDGPFKLTSTSNLILSLVIMPFSGGWYEHSWWTTHDGYNQHDRLN